MSQMTAAARPLRTPRRGPAPTPLRVIPSSISRTGNGVFVGICIALLASGLIALLLLNTALAQGSLALGDLQRESVHLSDTTGNLQEEIARASATGALAASAARIGMVRMNTRGYIDLSKGTVTGQPEPATSQNAFPVVTSPTPPSFSSTVQKVLSSGAASASSPGSGTGASSTAATPTTPGAGPQDHAASTLGGTPGASTGQPASGAASSQDGQAQQTTAR
ncbi:hypothetical protein GCM10009817_30660 [Terrabacter lapilli]|uniref:Cell division protein FtsL n=1 Tax=Terrabacter lapilli TaxID=436231 RepID=A0ABN2SI43_9MICO|nr:hypothetical protein [Terrabacter sp.]